jgi:hypothetical protein
MSEIRFGVWLLEQRDRQDPVGDLARDYIAGGCRGYSAREVRDHMTSVGASCYAANAMDQAVEEWTSL